MDRVRIDFSLLGKRMSGYIFTLHQCDGTIVNLDGPSARSNDLDDARAAAIQLARRVMTEEIKHGRLCLTCWIVVKTADGHALLTVPFGEAIELVDHPKCHIAG